MALLRPLSWAVLKPLLRSRFPKVQHLSTAKLADWLHQPDTEPPLLLDTRSPAEYAVSHLPHACRIDPKTDDFSELAVSLDAPIVAYCSVGYRSSRLADRLQAAGYTNVFNLEGSIFQWANEGRSLYRNEQPVQVVHPYSPTWGLLLKQDLHAYKP